MLVFYESLHFCPHLFSRIEVGYLVVRIVLCFWVHENDLIFFDSLKHSRNGAPEFIFVYFDLNDMLNNNSSQDVSSTCVKIFKSSEINTTYVGKLPVHQNIKI
jgi:hypothetical protein